MGDPVVTTSEFRQGIADYVNRAAFGLERILIVRRGKELAALVPIADLRLLERLEDEADAREADEALGEMQRTGAKPIPWEQVKKDLQRARRRKTAR